MLQAHLCHVSVPHVLNYNLALLSRL